MLNRQIGSILRGKATRLQVMLATVLGGTLGFVPGFFLPGDLGGGLMQAPGLIVVLLCLVLIANANLAIFGMVTLCAKLLSWCLLPVSYWLGTVLIDGPLTGLFRWLCNSQVTAWFGLEHYATTGGVVLGLMFGIGAGIVLSRTLRAIRTHMADVEENSERYQKFAGKWWVRLLTWAFLGKGKGKKKSWRDMAEANKLGMPIRISGAVVAVVFVASVLVFQQWFSTPILTSNLKAALETGNGATVDLESAALHFGAGELRVMNLALADAAELDRDLLAADELVMTIDTAELLRRRFVIDQIKTVNARAGTRRATPGVIIEKTDPEPEPEPPVEGVPTIDEYLAQYELWRARLAQAREWVEVVFAEGEAPAGSDPTEEIARERERQIEEVGLAGVIARHLFEERPRFLIRKVDIEGITWTRDGVEEVVGLSLRNISSDPARLASAPAFGFATESGSLAIDFSGPSSGDAGIGLAVAARGLSVDKVFSGLRVSGDRPVRGGTLDVEVEGTLGAILGRAMTMDLPLAVTMHGTTFSLGGRQARIEQFALPVGLRGDVTRPSVYLDDKAFANALLQAGQQELAGFVQKNAGKLLGDLPTKPEDITDAAKKKLEEEAKKGLEKVLPGGLGGLLGGKKKKKEK